MPPDTLLCARVPAAVITDGRLRHRQLNCSPGGFGFHYSRFERWQLFGKHTGGSHPFTVPRDNLPGYWPVRAPTLFPRCWTMSREQPANVLRSRLMVQQQSAQYCRQRESPVSLASSPSALPRHWCAFTRFPPLSEHTRNSARFRTVCLLLAVFLLPGLSIYDLEKHSETRKDSSTTHEGLEFL